MKRILFLLCAGIVFVTGIAVYKYTAFHDGKLHVVFCKVGQGDAIFIKTPDSKAMVIDTGPDSKVIDCLGRHLPFWNRNLDLALLTHPHTDHFVGFFYLLDSYNIKYFATERLNNKTPGFQELRKKLQEKQVTEHYVQNGDMWEFPGGLHVQIAGPTQDFLEQTSPGGTIGESKEFASLITHLTYGNFSALFTGDSQAAELQDAAEEIGNTINVLQTPHHGSATGLNLDILKMLQPRLAVISVGKNNYGQPTMAALQLITVPGITVKRTDQDGDVEVISDGEKWWIKK